MVYNMVKIMKTTENVSLYFNACEKSENEKLPSQ